MKSFRAVYEQFRKNETDATISKRANLHKATVSKLKSETIPMNRNYLWSLAMALRLTIPQTEELFAAGGLCMESSYHLTDQEKQRETMIKKCIEDKRYNVDSLNIQLYEQGYALLGNKLTGSQMDQS